MLSIRLENDQKIYQFSTIKFITILMVAMVCNVMIYSNLQKY